MKTRHPKPRALSEASRLAGGALSVLGLFYLALADYPNGVLAVLIGLIFICYLAVRTLVFFENDRFTPKRRRVSLTWAVAGIDEATREFDPRPVRVYFVLLTILFVGTTVRPFIVWLLT